MKRDCYERARALYKPDRIRVLLIGESRPSGGGFFYFADGPLFQATRDALSVFGAPKNPVRFLSWFWCQGFYLHDLCREPVDKTYTTAPHVWRRLVRSGERKLAKLIRDERIPVLITVPKRISEFAERAIVKSGVCLPLAVLPFPARNRTSIRNYKLGLRKTLRGSAWEPRRHCQ